MTWRYYIRMLFASLLLVLLVGVPAYGLDIGVLTNGVGMSEHLGLEDSTSFEGSTVLSDGNIFHDHEAKGSGNNIIQDTVGGNKYTTTNTVVSSGTLSTSSSAAASAESAVTSQNTKASGDVGYVGADATSSNNKMQLAAGFQGSGGNIDTQLVTSAGQSNALVDGSANVNNIKCYNGGITGTLVSAADLGLSVDGLYKTQDGQVGNFGLSASNTKSQTSAPYSLAGWRWNTQNPKIQLYLRDDNLPTGISNGGGVNTAADKIGTAAGLWDAQTNQALFATPTVTISDLYGISTNAPDYKNVHAFMTIKDSTGKTDTNTIAYAQTWYSRSRVGYNSALDSDVVYNNYFGWSFGGVPGSSSQPIDFQTIACHELGHTLGLGDLYNTGSAYQAQMMYGYYIYPKSSLGNGDKAGIQKLYGGL